MSLEHIATDGEEDDDNIPTSWTESGKGAQPAVETDINTGCLGCKLSKEHKFSQELAPGFGIHYIQRYVVDILSPVQYRDILIIINFPRREASVWVNGEE